MLVGDDTVGKVQAQTRANARALRRKEGVEGASLNLGWDPWPVVDNFDHDVAVFGVCARQVLPDLAWHKKRWACWKAATLLTC